MLIPINFLLSLICLLLLVKRWQAGWVWRGLLLLCLVHSLNAGIGTLLSNAIWHQLQPVTGAMLPVACLLALLARKAGIPARRVSAAINALRQQSVSQYVNGWRIREACERLRREEGTVIEIMEEVGFLTKSNFNREFRRVCGTTPTEWRQSPSEQTELTR